MIVYIVLDRRLFLHTDNNVTVLGTFKILDYSGKQLVQVEFVWSRVALISHFFSTPIVYVLHSPFGRHTKRFGCSAKKTLFKYEFDQTLFSRRFDVKLTEMCDDVRRRTSRLAHHQRLYGQRVWDFGGYRLFLINPVRRQLRFIR